jgi:MFS transporter, SHS family, sialic acid transporter
MVIGAMGAGLTIFLWTIGLSWVLRALGTAIGLALAALGYTFPVRRYLARVEKDGGVGGQGSENRERRTSNFELRSSAEGRSSKFEARSLAPDRWLLNPFSSVQILRRMLLGACLSGVPLLCTWGATQWIPTWADQLAGAQNPGANTYAGMSSACGAIVGAILGALAGKWVPRRIIYAVLCILSLVATAYLFRFQTTYGVAFLVSVFFVGLTTASFYGWLPLYLPELYPTRVRATGQGFSYNFGRILAAMGVLQVGSMMSSVFKNNYPEALSIVSLVYVAGFVLIWFAPETFGKPLPE